MHLLTSSLLSLEPRPKRDSTLHWLIGLLPYSIPISKQVNPRGILCGSNRETTLAYRGGKESSIGTSSTASGSSTAEGNGITLTNFSPSSCSMSGGVNMWRERRPCVSGETARKNMRILNISQTYYPYLAEGGRPTKVLTISRRLSKRGHQVTVLTADLGAQGAVPFPASIEHTRSGRRAEHEGVETIYLRTRLR